MIQKPELPVQYMNQGDRSWVFRTLLHPVYYACTPVHQLLWRLPTHGLRELSRRTVLSQQVPSCLGNHDQSTYHHIDIHWLTSEVQDGSPGLQEKQFCCKGYAADLSLIDQTKTRRFLKLSPCSAFPPSLSLNLLTFSEERFSKSCLPLNSTLRFCF